jgi:hypothetical protein
MPELKTQKGFSSPAEVEGLNSKKRVPWYLFVVFVWGLVVLGLEYLFDVPSNPVICQIVVVLDLLVVTGFLFFVVTSMYRFRAKLRAWAAHEIIDVLVALLTVTVLFMPRFAASLVIGRLISIILMRVLDTRAGRLLF